MYKTCYLYFYRYSLITIMFILFLIFFNNFLILNEVLNLNYERNGYYYKSISSVVDLEIKNHCF